LKAENGLVRILKREGVLWVSTFPVSGINNACGEEGVSNLMMRTERFAVAVADGYSRVSNGKQIGVCSVMGGLNAAGLQAAYGGVAQAYEDSSPILCISRGLGTSTTAVSHYDIVQSFSGVTKWIGCINQASRIPEFMRRAFTYLRTGRPGPVLILIPPDLGKYSDSEYPYKTVKGWKHPGNPRDVELAVKALLNAKRPLIYAGQGVFYADACEELRRFAESVQAPVLTTLKGKSVFPENHPLSIGVRGGPATHYLECSDLVFGIGTSLAPGRFSHRIPSGKIIIQSTIDELDINRCYSIDHAIIGDAKLVLNQLITEIQRQTGQSEPGEKKNLTEEIKEIKNAFLEEYIPLLTSEDVPINPYRVYWDLMQTIDRENSSVTHDSGNTRDQTSTIYEATIPHGYIGWGNVSTLGFGLGAATGAKLAYPERTVVNITGDAGVGYQLGNYESLVRNKIGITTIHINNSGFAGYGPGFWGPGHDPYTSSVTSSDKMNMARSVEAIGEYAERVEMPDEIVPALKRAFKVNKSGKPAYLEIICSQYPVFGRWVGGIRH
jgi:thiamine pyrophosphate-dependent acetolactate synthase large subunit-like protein